MEGSGIKWGVVGELVDIKEVPRIPMVTALKRTVFVGTFRHSVDEKKRLAIPAKWRAAAKGNSEFYVLPMPNHHLFVLPESAMEKMMEQADGISIGEYDRRSALRLIMGGAQSAQLDSQGRIILTEKLIAHAELDDEAVLVGMLKGFEIWSPARHAQVQQQDAGQFTELAKQLGL